MACKIGQMTSFRLIMQGQSKYKCNLAHVIAHSNCTYTQHRIVESFEIIAIGLAQQENFTELTITNENIAVMIESVSQNMNAYKRKSH